MYTAFYGLREKPFALVPDPRYLFLSEAHREALAHLLYGIDQGEGFIAVTGEVGTGKTTICRTLLERLGAGTEAAFLFNPSRSGIELLQDISTEFGLETEGKNRSELGAQLNQFLLAKKADRRPVLLIIDEAQNLSEDTLEQVRLLSNLETSSSKLIQILLLGQPELDSKLDSPDLRQLRQRISVRWGLGPLSARETREYVKHRLYVAAGAERTIFTDAGLREVHRRTGGVPRLVNVLCDRALLAGFVQKSSTIGVRIVKQAASEIQDARGRRWFRKRRARKASERSSLAIAAAAAIGAAIGIAALAGVIVAVGGLPGVQVPLSEQVPAALPVDETEPQLVAEVASPPPVDVAQASEFIEVADTAILEAPPLPEADADPVVSTARADARALALESPQFDAQPAVRLDEPAAAGLGQVAPGEVAEGGIQDGSFLALALANEEAAASRLGAVNAMLRSFGFPDSAEAPPNDASALAMLTERGLAVLPLRWANLATLRALNHPAMVRVGGRDAEPRLLALSHLEEDRVWLHGLMGDQPLRVPLSELRAGWSGEAWVVWNEFEPGRLDLAFGHQGSGVLWLQSALAELGYYAGDTSGLFDGLTRDSVVALQQQRSIPADGIAGPQTRMVLYDLLDRYEVPRLVADPPELRGDEG